MATATVIIGGDVCPVGRNEEAFLRGDGTALLGGLLPDFGAADLRIANLECPLAEGLVAAEKSGPHLSTKPGCVAGLRALGIDVVGLANNHVLDFGPEGLRKTIELCSAAHLDTVGAGANLQEARQPRVRTVQGLRLGVMAFADHECSIATDSSAGANPLSEREFVRLVRRHGGSWDRLIVLCHAGKEHYPYPSPMLQQMCRFLVEEGAAAVICQHSHCPGCYEHYRGGHIVYGQGNLIFDDYPQRQGQWNRGFLVRLSFPADGTTEMDLIPYIQSDARPGARPVSADEGAAFRRDLQARSARVQEEGFVEREWRAFCRKQRDLYFSILRGHSRPVRALNRMMHFTNWLYSRAKLRTLHNVVRCDAHREVLQTILSEER